MPSGVFLVQEGFQRPLYVVVECGRYINNINRGSPDEPRQERCISEKTQEI